MTVHQEARVRRRARLRGSTAGRALAACMVGVVFSFPLAIMAIGSLRKPGLPPPGGLELLPDVIRSGNYETAAGLIPLGQQLLNSVLVVSTAVPVTVLVASWAGFAIVMARPAVRRLLIGIALVVLSMPASAMWVPRKVMLEQLGLTDHALVVALPAVMGTTPFYVLLFAFAYHRIPRSLYEVAAVEQASVFRIWRSVAFPLARPTMFAVARSPSPPTGGTSSTRSSCSARRRTGRSHSACAPSPHSSRHCIRSTWQQPSWPPPPPRSPSSPHNERSPPAATWRHDHGHRNPRCAQVLPFTP